MKNNLAITLSISSLVIAVLTLGFVIINTMSNQRESGYQARVLEENLEYMSASESNIEVYRVYVESLRQALVSKGFQAPALPEIKKVKPIQMIRKERSLNANPVNPVNPHDHH